MLKLKYLYPFGVVLNPQSSPCNLSVLATEQLTELLMHHKLLILRGFNEMDESGLKQFANSLGPLLRWEFGEVLNLRVEEHPKNHLFRTDRVEMHWDGAYLTETPKYSLFQCLESTSTGVGGETIFTDTTALVERLTHDQQTHWEKIRISYLTEKAAHYTGSITTPLISKHPHTGKPTVRVIEPFNEDNEDINPVHFNVEGMEEILQPQFIRSVIKEIYAPEVMYQHQWHKGDFLIYDNNALLHGRNRLLGNAKRHLQRVHILENNGSFDSRPAVFSGARQKDVHV